MDKQIISSVKRAIALFGSEELLAKSAGVSQPAINKAKRTGKIGVKVALGIHRATDGEVHFIDFFPSLIGEIDDPR
jgi:DNA-binding transcriptional regulator YdaS (Cro superfamily)